MTAFTAQIRTTRRSRILSWPALAVVCVALFALLAVMQVPHLHDATSHPDHCPLCVVMHTTAPVAAVASAVVMVLLGASEPQAEHLFVARRPQSRIFIRPPPVFC